MFYRVGISVNERINRAVIGIWLVTEKISLITSQGKSFNITAMLCTNRKVHRRHRNILAHRESQEITRGMGDLNAKVGKKDVEQELLQKSNTQKGSR